MWNKLAEILLAPSSMRLSLAIVISAVLHTLFFGNVDFSLPSFKQDMHVIEARIQMPKAVIKSAAHPTNEELPQEIAPQVIQPEQIVPPAANNDEPSQQLAEVVIQPVVETKLQPPVLTPPVAETEPQPSVVIPVENTQPDENQPQDIGLVINENAYQYVETEFEASFKKDGMTYQGLANINYNLDDANRYLLRWLIQGKGLAALSPDLLQTSDGELTSSGLKPSHYLYQFDKKVHKTRSASFDWQAKKVNLQTAKGTKTEDLPEGTQDLLSFMYQFMYVPPLQQMQLSIVNGKKLRIYDYSFEGEEQVNSRLGELKTIHILHSGSSEEEKTELWLAIDYQYIPVKIRKIENDGSVVEMLATRITTNRPVVNQ